MSAEESRIELSSKDNSINDTPLLTDIKEINENMKRLHPEYFSECCPIKTLDDLYTVINSPPLWVNRIIPREIRSATVIQNVLSDCHVPLNGFIPKSRNDVKFIPKTLVCHDYKGGYLEDRYLEEVNKGSCYTFYNWSHIDIFVYFSHNFITIPPLCWLNVAHQNGVRVLGTFITEFNEGEKICQEIFRDIPTMQMLAKHLAKLTTIFKFDGWLLNIENPIADTSILKAFVGFLTQCVHLANPENVVIWYDSVIEEGKLSWQNELNEKNLCFFDQCDGIFLNYVWKEENLINSIANAAHRITDIFVGVDVFGRNTFGGGQFNCFKAAELIRRHGLSMAIFAPGWTHESIPADSTDFPLLEHFLNKDLAFWNSLWPYLYTHPINTFFETSFFRGVDYKRFNLFQQEQQLSKILHPKYISMIPNYSAIPTLNNKCSCLTLEHNNNNSFVTLTKSNLNNSVEYVHKLFLCDIEAEGEIIVYYFLKPDLNSCVNLQLLIYENSGSFHKVTLNGEKSVEMTNSSITEINPIESEYMLNSLDIFYNEFFKDKDFILRAYSFYLRPCRILEIGAILERGNNVCIGAFGIKRYTFLRK